MRAQRFGIEIEITGITRATAAKTLANCFDTSVVHVGGSYHVYTVRDREDRQWKILRDGSIRPESARFQRDQDEYKVEVVSPICRYEDIETIQKIIRSLRHAGARVNSSCGIHVHVDAAPHTAKTLRNLVNIMEAKEDLLYKALQVDVARKDYCQQADLTFLEDLNRRRPQSMDSIEEIWYRNHGGGSRYSHYDKSRYHAFYVQYRNYAENPF